MDKKPNPSHRPIEKKIPQDINTLQMQKNIEDTNELTEIDKLLNQSIFQPLEKQDSDKANHENLIIKAFDEFILQLDLGKLLLAAEKKNKDYLDPIPYPHNQYNENIYQDTNILEVSSTMEVFLEANKVLNQQLQDNYKNVNEEDLMFNKGESLLSMKKRTRSLPKLQMQQQSEDSTELTNAIWNGAVEAMILQKQEADENDDDIMKDLAGLRKLFEMGKHIIVLNKPKSKSKYRKDTKRLKIPNGGIDIASVSGTKVYGSIKKEETIEDLKSLLNAPVTLYSNVQNLHEKIRKLINWGDKIQGLEPKMHALLQEVEDNDFKKDGRKRKKSFLGWLRKCDETDDAWESLKELKNRAVNQGIKLSHLLVDVMFFIAKSVAKFEVLGASLEWVLQGERSVVICRIVYVLDTADRVMRKKKEAKDAWQKSIKGKAAMMVDEARSERREKEECYVEDVSDKPILGLLKLTLLLELFWVHRGLPNSKMPLKDALALLVADVEKCDEALKGIEAKIIDLTQLSELGLAAEDLINVKTSSEYKANELWNRIEV